MMVVAGNGHPGGQRGLVGAVLVGTEGANRGHSGGMEVAGDGCPGADRGDRWRPF